jgi:hypothetical protein
VERSQLLLSLERLLDISALKEAKIKMTVTVSQIKSLIQSIHETTNIRLEHTEHTAVICKKDNDHFVVDTMFNLTNVPQEDWHELFGEHVLEAKGCSHVLLWQIGTDRVFDEGDVPYFSVSHVDCKDQSITFYTASFDLSDMKEAIRLYNKSEDKDVESTT